MGADEFGFVWPARFFAVFGRPPLAVSWADLRFYGRDGRTVYYQAVRVELRTGFNEVDSIAFTANESDDPDFGPVGQYWRRNISVGWGQFATTEMRWQRRNGFPAVTTRYLFEGAGENECEATAVRESLPDWTCGVDPGPPRIPPEWPAFPEP